MAQKLQTLLKAHTKTLLAVGATLGCSDAATTIDSNNDNPDLGTGGNETAAGTGGDGSPGDGGAPITTSGGASSGGAGTGGDQAAGTGGVLIHPTCPGNPQSAYGGLVPTLPGTIQAENFDVDGYSDDTAGNDDGAYRTDVDVDIKELGEGATISWFTSGEWVEFTVNVTMPGHYSVTAQVAATEAGRTLQLSSCGDALGTLEIPVLDDWGTLVPTDPVVVELTAGLQVIRVTVGPQDYVDLDSLTFTVTDDMPGAGGSAGTGGMVGAGGTDNTGGMVGSGGTNGAPSKFVGNITTQNSADTDGLVFSDYWDQITPENAGKWQSVQGNIENARNWDTLTALYDYAQQKGILFKQHVFVWGAQQPSGNITEADVKSWMNEFCDRFPNTPLIDVVNEPPPHTEPNYANAIGGGTNTSWQWIINSFIWAEEACPDSILILNDYNNIEYADQNQHFIDIANTVKDAGAPIHAVGAQSHALHGQFGASTATMKELLTKLHDDTGLVVYITEYDIGEANDQIQLQKYQDHIGYFLETEWIHGITLWGWINGKTWIDDSGIMNGSSPRPAMTWLMNELGRPVP